MRLLLDAIYSSPAQLLEKAEKDGAALVSALRRYDEAAVRDALFNFAVTAYHICDWVKAYRPDLAATNPLDLHESLRACRDLANASKHVVLTQTQGPYLRHPPIVQEVAMSAPPFVADRAVSWRLKIQLPGRRIPTEELVREALEAWKQYFTDHSIK